MPLLHRDKRYLELDRALLAVIPLWEAEVRSRRSLLLYYSTCLGRTWHMHARLGCHVCLQVPVLCAVAQIFDPTGGAVVSSSIRPAHNAVPTTRSTKYGQSAKNKPGLKFILVASARRKHGGFGITPSPSLS